MTARPEPSIIADAVAHEAVDAAMAVHRTLGPGLLESVYEQCFAIELTARRIRFERQKPLALYYQGQTIKPGFRLDLVLEDTLVVEVKSCAALLPLHGAQLVTYLKLSGLSLGLLINFNVALLKDGIRRVLPGAGQNLRGALGKA